MLVPQLRPLKKIRRGIWSSRDGHFQFVNGETVGADFVNWGWHIYDVGQGPGADAWGDREPTLRDAAAAVEYEYRGLAKADGRRPILDAFAGSPLTNTQLMETTGLTYHCVSAWTAHLVFEGALVELLHNRVPKYQLKEE